MRLFRDFVAPTCLSVSLAAGALAQTPPPETPAGPGARPAPPAAPADEVGRALGARADALACEAGKLVEEYRKALEGRFARRAEEDPTLHRLQASGFFTLEHLLSGVSDEPLPALNDIRKVYAAFDDTVASYIGRFGGVAREQTQKAAVEYMRKVVEAQRRFRAEDANRNQVPDYALSFRELGGAGLLHVPPMKKEGSESIEVEGYRFRIIRGDNLHWAADAAPLRPEATSLWLYADQRGEVRGEEGKPAGPQSAVVK